MREDRREARSCGKLLPDRARERTMHAQTDRVRACAQTDQTRADRPRARRNKNGLQKIPIVVLALTHLAVVQDRWYRVSHSGN